MVRVRFARGQLGGFSQWAPWARPAERGRVKSLIEEHLSHRIHRSGENLDRVIGRCYRVPVGVLLTGHSGPVWPEYDVLHRSRSDAFLVRLVKLAPSPLPDPPIAGPVGADPDQCVESPPSPVSSEF